MTDSAAPRAPLERLDVVWFQVAGTLCNLACRHCLVSSSPTNRTHEMLTAQQIRPHLADGAALGAREFYFTGGEPFLNPEMEAILAEALEFGAATVLTNGLLLDQGRCERLSALAATTGNSLDVRVSLDGWNAAENDAIRGTGTFDRAVDGARRLARAGLNPVLTVTAACADVASEAGRQRLVGWAHELGFDRPRLKVLPLFRIGAEVAREGGYAGWQRLQQGDVSDGWAHLQCSSSRMVTAAGVWVCPILVNDPRGRMGARLDDSLGTYELEHPACWTCHVEGATCRT